MIDHGAAGGQTCGELARKRAFVLTRYRTPEQDLAAAHDHADLGCVDFTVAMHLLLDTTTQLGIGRGNLIHTRALIGRVHRGETVQTACLLS